MRSFRARPRVGLLTLLAAGVLTAAAGLSGRARSSPLRTDPVQPQVEQPDEALAFPVEAATVVRGTLTLPVLAAGEAEASRAVTLPAGVSGRVARVRVREGDAVRAGETIVLIDAEPYRLEARQARAALEQAELAYRELTLLDERIADEALREERRRAARVRSGLDLARLRVERAELEVERAAVRAPFAGRIGSVAVQADAWVEAGTPLLDVLQLHPIRLEVQTLEGDLRWLEIGSAVRAVFSALPGEDFDGTVTSINPSVDRVLRTARVGVLLSNPDGRILPGMYARVRMAGRALPDRLLVPRAAVLERDRRALVFVHQPDSVGGIASWRWVEVGETDGALVELLRVEGDPIEAGDVVLTAGHEGLVHGARVRLTDGLASAGDPEAG